MNNSNADQAQYLKKIVLVLCSVSVALVISEVLLRLLGFTYFNPYTVDRDLGFTLNPNVEGWWTKENRVYVKINSRGLRDVEHTLTKPPNTIRIAVLGDSFAEALQVSIQNTFWSIMQRQLQDVFAARGKTVEVLNFGVSGFSTARELVMLRKHVWAYDPDLVLLLVTPANDIKDNSASLSDYKEPLPYFVYENDQLRLDDSTLQRRNQSLVYRLQESFPGKLWNSIRARSRVLGLIYSVREAQFERDKAKRSQYETGIDPHVFLDPASSPGSDGNPDWSRAWLVTEKLLITMRNEVEAGGAKFLLVTGSNGVQVNPSETVRAAYMKSLAVSNLFYPEMRIRKFGEREKIEVLTLAPQFLEFAKQTQTYVHGFASNRGRGHWNEEGHKLAADLITKSLLRELDKDGSGMQAKAEGSER